ncbi:MAG: hypothetical protein K8I60_12065, partial [Anaerolineae bacterium]|nr:hypothetical protein [Anaerolineae bacterium]
MQDNVHPTGFREDRTEPAQPAASRSRHWFMRLTEPSASLQNPKQRYQAQFVATLMVLALPVIVPLGIIVAFRQNDSPSALNPHQTWIIGAAWITLVAAYLLSRTQWYRFAAWIGILSSTAGTVLMTLTFPHRSEVDFFLISSLALPTLVASVMLSRWQTIGFAGLIAIITLVVPSTFATVEWSPRLLIPFAFYVSSSTIILIYGYYRDRLEADRQTELRRKDFRLQAAYETLEQRIIERTNELSQINQQLQQQINEREQAEAALIQERTLLRTIVD